MSEFFNTPFQNEPLIALLEEAGIATPQQLAELGSCQAFVRIRTLLPGAGLTLLYSIEGLLCQAHWQSLPDERLKELRMFWNRLIDTDTDADH